MTDALKAVASAHSRLVHGRRVRKLAQALGPLCEPGWSVLDVGCGDGRLGALLAREGRDLTLRGLELSVRAETHIPVQEFDGHRLPLADASVDAVLFVDVLHHTHDPVELLTEARRVARKAILLKDHRTSRPLAHGLLRFMDWVGNKPHGVPLPYNYWSEARWAEAWSELGLRVDRYETRLELYPWVARWAFESGLHFVARLVPE